MNEHTAFIKNPEDMDWVIFSTYCLKSRSASLAMKVILWCMYNERKNSGHKEINYMCIYHAEQYLFHLVVAANYCFWILQEASQCVLCFVLR